MTLTTDTSSFRQYALQSLAAYGRHVQLTAMAAALLEAFIFRKSLPTSYLLPGLLGHGILSLLSLHLVARHNNKNTTPDQHDNPILLFIPLLLALGWGSSIFLFHTPTLLAYAIHILFLYGICILFTTYLAAFPVTAAAFLVLCLTPTLYVLFSSAPDPTSQLAYFLLALAGLQGFLISFHNQILRRTIHRQVHQQQLHDDLTSQLQQQSAIAEKSSALSVLKDFKAQLQKFTEQKAVNTLKQNEAIWNAILTITDQSQVQDNWQNCFSGKLSNLCQPLEIDRIYIVEADRNNTDPTLLAQNKYQATIDHSWIFNNQACVAVLEQGNVLHNESPQLSDQERKALKELGIQAFLDIPILLKNNLWGIIGMDRLKSAAPFTTQQLHGLKFIANILALTIRNQQDRSERDRLVTVIEQSSDCTLITDPSGEILYANPACESITGYSQTEILGADIKSLYPQSTIDSATWEQITTAIKNGDKWQGQFTNHRKDHTLYEEEMLMSPAYDHEGRVVNQVIVKRNITEKKRLESIVEAANLMDNIGFIFSSIRHELGNPINSIKVSLSILDSNLEIYDKTNIKRFINRSLSDIGRVEYLLKTLKNFSTFERPIIEKTDLTALLNKFISLVTTDLNQKKIQLSAEIPFAPLMGMIDPRAFQQVLLNLIANAADSLVETLNKQITLTMFKEDNGQINIIIGDNGCGISGHEQTNLFKPFFTTKPQGTGLGLVIVKKMLSKMNCSIDIHSRNNQGTKVLIVIPGL